MSDNKSQRAPEDGRRIDINEDYEIEYWTKELGVTEDELLELVRNHGTSVDAVRKAAKS